MTARTTAPPEYRGRSLSTLVDIERTAEVVRVEGGLLATYRMSGVWFWRDRGGGWYEMQGKGSEKSKIA